MPRTRDLVLFGLTICFLFVAIGGTVVSRFGGVESVQAPRTPESTLQSAAVVVTDTESTRAERLEAMRLKVAAAQDLVSLSPQVEEVVLVQEPSDESLVPTSTDVTTLECSTMQSYRGFWSPTGVQFMESEGVRVVYRDTGMTASGTAIIEPLLQLPIRTFSDASPQCIGTDVVGIAQDGSLMRNNELALYGVFGADTLIGYALDGFPIYGVASVAVDECGGAFVAGQYRYYLSGERDTLLGCFAAPPVMLP